jgi:hypothetical protein
MVTDKGYVDVGFWHASQKGLITAAGDSGPRFEPAVETAIASVGPKNKEGVVTATRTLGGQLKLIVWEDDERGDLVPKTYYKLAENPTDGGAVSAGIDLSEIPSIGLGDLVTVERNGSSALQLTAWQVGA